MDWIPNIFRRRAIHHLHDEQQPRIEKRSREVWHRPSLESIWSDMRLAMRQMRRSPGFTAAALLTMALAIGANAVVFGVINRIVLHPLEVPGATSLYAFETSEAAIGHISFPDYVDFRERNRSFEDLAGFSITEAVLDSGANPSRVWAYETSGNYFDVLRLKPHLGRFFHANDERGPNSAPYAVLSYSYWSVHFQGDRSVVGRVVLVNRRPYTVIGIAPQGFEGTVLFFSPDCFLPIVNKGQIDGGSPLSERDNQTMWEPFGHLKPGISQAQAITDLNAIGAHLDATYSRDNKDHRKISLIRPGIPIFVGRPLRAFVAALMFLACLILLAACANLGGLFAARAADRSHEIAVRLALGSRRRRILRELLTEALLISLTGGAAGLLVSIMLLRWLSVWQPFPNLAIHLPASPDVNVYLAALALALISGFLSGIVPVRQVFNASPYEAVKAGSLRKIGRRITTRDLLLGLQIALCAVLVTASMVAVRGLMRSLNANFGFDLRNAMVAAVELKLGGYSGEAVAPFGERMIDAMKSIPGVEQAALISNPPLVGGAGWTVDVFKDGKGELRPANVAATSFQYMISPDYFKAAGTALLAGRAFTPQDNKSAPLVAVINQEFARRMFASQQSALGRYFRTSDGMRRMVVGIVEDGTYFKFGETQQPAMFLPVPQWTPLNSAWLVVRSPRDPQQLGALMRSKLRELDSGLPIVEIETWTKGMDFALFPAHMAAVCLGVMGMMGGILSITGIFGMAAYTVGRRLKELGIRIALGAQKWEVLRTALGRALRLLAFGSAGGLLAGMLASRLLAHIVYQATPQDPMVLAGVVVAMSLLGLLATWIPAQRALSVDPLILLRED